MKERPEKKPYTRTEYLAGYQILAGFAGLILWSQSIFKTSELDFSLILVFLLFILLYSHAIVSGILIFKKEDLGLKHSAINQALQIFSFSLFGLSFQYYAGIGIKFTFNLLQSFFPYINLGISSSELLILDDSGIRSIGINIPAVIISIFILKQRKKIRAGDLNEQISRMGS